MLNPKAHAERLAEAAGITLNGSADWDIQVHNPALFRRVLLLGSLGLGDAYVDGWWDCKRLDLMFEKLIGALKNRPALPYLPERMLAASQLLYNQQTRRRSRKVAEVHYNLGNDFYQLLLDQRMIYSCGYWQNADTLDDAQYAKLDMICRKLELNRGETLLDIGCGWGGMARFAAEHYGVKVTGVTISSEQAKLATETCRGLPVEILLADYRSVTGRFDKIVSIGMFEHVGPRNYLTFMRHAHRLIADDGLFLLHTIGSSRRSAADPWIARHIFPNSRIPHLDQVTAAAMNLWRVEDLHNFGPHYASTLRAWYDNLERCWPEMSRQLELDERFRRKWHYYLLCCAGAFGARSLELWQFVMRPFGSRLPYQSLRP